MIKRPKIKDYIEHRGDTAIGLYGQAENYVDALDDHIDHLEEQLEKAKQTYCTCTNDESTGWIETPACNICGKIVESELTQNQE